MAFPAVHILRFRLIPLLGAFAFLSMAGAAAETCKDAQRAASILVQSADEDTGLDQFKDMISRTATAQCDNSYREKLGRAFALLALRGLSERAESKHGSPTITEMQQIAELGRPWQLMAILGDAHYTKATWPKAYLAYDDALQDLEQTDKSAGPGMQRYYADIYARSVAAWALSPPEIVAERRKLRPPLSESAPRFRNFGTADQLDEALWTLVENASDDRLLEAYLIEFPKGAHAMNAKGRLGD